MNGITQLQGDIFAGYKLLRLIGKGGNGVVYLARQLTVDRVLACKILYPEFVNDPVYLQNFIHEARMAARLEHPNIIQALDVGRDGSLYYIAMEYVSGVSLEKIRTGNPEKLNLLFLLDISIALADALDYAWKKFHIFHGDIKPDNLLINARDGLPKLADLGLAKIVGKDDLANDIMATPLYASPEVITASAEHIGIKSDIYSFGIMLYELVSGHAPFKGSIETVLQRHLEEVPPPLGTVSRHVDREFAAFVDSMIEKSPERRPEDWHVVRQHLVRIRERLQNTSAGKKPLHPPAAAAGEKNGGTLRESAAFFFGILFLLVLAGVCFLIFKKI